MAFCYNCGSQLDDNVLFCPNCGAKNVANAAAAQQSAPQAVQYQQPAPQPVQYQQPVAQVGGVAVAAPVKKKSKLPIIIISAVAALAIAAVLIIGLVLNGGKPYVGAWAMSENGVPNYRYIIAWTDDGKITAGDDTDYFKDVGNNIIIGYSDEACTSMAGALRYEINGNTMVVTTGTCDPNGANFYPNGNVQQYTKLVVDSSTPICGVWQDMYSDIIVYITGDKVYGDGVENEYKLIGNKIIVTNDGYEDEGTYSLNGDDLMIRTDYDILMFKRLF